MLREGRSFICLVVKKGDPKELFPGLIENMELNYDHVSRKLDSLNINGSVSEI